MQRARRAVAVTPRTTTAVGSLPDRARSSSRIRLERGKSRPPGRATPCGSAAASRCRCARRCPISRGTHTHGGASSQLQGLSIPDRGSAGISPHQSSWTAVPGWLVLPDRSGAVRCVLVAERGHRVERFVCQRHVRGTGAELKGVDADASVERRELRVRALVLAGGHVTEQEPVATQVVASDRVAPVDVAVFGGQRHFHLGVSRCSKAM